MPLPTWDVARPVSYGFVSTAARTDNTYQPRGTMVFQIHTSSSSCQYTEYDSHRCAILQRVRYVTLTRPFTVSDFCSHCIRPGHGKVNLNAQVSIAYNRDVSLNTVRWAIVDWLRDEHKDGIWKVCVILILSLFRDHGTDMYIQEVISSHFCLLHDKIRAK